MATYKVLQDIEAEDKLLGPLSLKQFGFAAVTLVCLYISFLLISKGVWFMSIPFLPIAFVSGFLAFPWGRDQSTEVWLLAKIRFFFKPRKRIWDQQGIEELVTITAPKKQNEDTLTKDFDREEAKSRLKALANTIDSRGWVVKNVDVNLYAHPDNSLSATSQDRLLDTSSFVQPQAVLDIHATDDVLDENNQAAQQVTQLLNASSTNHREQILSQMQTGFRSLGSQDGDLDDSMIGITPDVEEAFLKKRIREKSKPNENSGLRTIQPLSAQPRRASVSQQATTNPVGASGSTSVNPAILTLADNDDLNVATIAREANKAAHGDNPDEVVVSLR